MTIVGRCAIQSKRPPTIQGGIFSDRNLFYCSSWSHCTQIAELLSNQPELGAFRRVTPPPPSSFVIMHAFSATIYVHLCNFSTEKFLVHQQRASGGTVVAVRVFVLFSNLAEAATAMRKMHGRFFAGNQVHAAAYDQAMFSRGLLDA